MTPSRAIGEIRSVLRKGKKSTDVVRIIDLILEQVGDVPPTYLSNEIHVGSRYLMDLSLLSDRSKGGSSITTYYETVVTEISDDGEYFKLMVSTPARSIFGGGYMSEVEQWFSISEIKDMDLLVTRLDAIDIEYE
jgi:hypothetical protein